MADLRRADDRVGAPSRFVLDIGRLVFAACETVGDPKGPWFYQDTSV